MEQAVVGMLILALIFLISLWMVIWRKRTAGPDAPAVPGRLPLIGHLLRLGGAQPIVRTLGDLADKYGPFITLWIGVYPSVVVSSWEFAKECLVTNDKVLATRPPLVAGKYLGYDYAVLGFSFYGDYWREIRKLVTLEILSARRLEQLKHIRITEVELSMEDLYRRWADNGKAPTKVEMKEWFGDQSFNNIVMIIAGKRFFGKYAKEDEAEARKFRRVIEEFFYLAGLFVPSEAIPALEWFDIGGHIRAMKRVGKDLDAVYSWWLEEHRVQRRSGKVQGGDRDFLDVMLSVVDKFQLADYDADMVIKATCSAMILAGFDTTSVTLTWALSLLLNNPRVLQKAQEEIDAQVGKDRKVGEEDIKDLPYLNAIVKETLRLYPPAPLSVPHQAMEDCKIAGYNIPAGTRTMVNLWKMHRDPRIYSDPSEFRPERFLFENTRIDLKGQNFELIPFGAGRRMCPGLSFGLQVLHLTLARLLQGFDMQTPSGGPVDMPESMGVNMSKATPLQVMMFPRLSSDLYVL